MGRRERGGAPAWMWFGAMALGLGGLALGCTSEVGEETEETGRTTHGLTLACGGRGKVRTRSTTVPGGVDRWASDAGGDWSYITLGDIDNDGLDDLCGLRGRSYGCLLNDGAYSFQGTFLSASAFDGLGRDQYHSTIRIVDIDDDDRGDLCGRMSDGIVCQRFAACAFGPKEIWSSSFKDAYGWTQPEYYSTIAFPELRNIHDPGTSAPAVCGRGYAGIHCFFRNGSRTKFLDASILVPNFADWNGWTQPEYYETIQFADIDGDGFDDVCGRGIDGIWCARFENALTRRFERLEIWTHQFRDSHGWRNPVYYRSIRLGDINGDGLADICGRGIAGVHCGLSRARPYDSRRPTSSGFVVSGTPVVPGMSDAAGFDGTDLYAESMVLVDLRADGRADVCALGPHRRSNGNLVHEIHCAESTSSWVSMSFAPLHRLTSRLAALVPVASGRIHPGSTGFCRVHPDGVVDCTNPF